LADEESKIVYYINETRSQNEYAGMFLDDNLDTQADSINAETIFRLANFTPLKLELPVLLNEISFENTITDNVELIKKLRDIDSRNLRKNQTQLIWIEFGLIRLSLLC